MVEWLAGKTVEKGTKKRRHSSLNHLFWTAQFFCQRCLNYELLTWINDFDDFHLPFNKDPLITLFTYLGLLTRSDTRFLWLRAREEAQWLLMNTARGSLSQPDGRTSFMSLGFLHYLMTEDTLKISGRLHGVNLDIHPPHTPLKICRFCHPPPLPPPHSLMIGMGWVAV